MPVCTPHMFEEKQFLALPAKNFTKSHFFLGLFSQMSQTNLLTCLSKIDVFLEHFLQNLLRKNHLELF